MPVRVAADVEMERVVEDGLVAVGRRVGQQQGLASLHRDYADFGVGGGGAHEFLDRSDPADHLVGSGRQQGRVAEQPVQLGRVLDESVQAAGDGGAGGVVPGGGDDDVVGGGVEVRQVLAVDSGIGDRRGKVAGRSGPARA